MIENNKRYLQIAFNSDISQVRRILPRIPYDERILIEAGAHVMKREGLRGISAISGIWKG